MMFGFISEIKGKNSENLPMLGKHDGYGSKYQLTLQYSDLDAENWENGRTYYVSGFSYFFQCWKRPC